MNLLKSLAALTLFAALLVSCTDDDDDPDVTNGDLEIEVHNLPDPGDNFDYYAWLIGGNGVNLKLGEVTDLSDSIVMQSWRVGDLDFLSMAESVIISVEEEGIQPVLPSTRRITIAEFGVTANNSADFSSTSMRSSLDDFDASTGLYFLATPTTSTMSEETSGIWFGDYNTGIPIPSLNLPDLNTGWVYQGWVEIDQGPRLGTGAFYIPVAADLASPYSGPLDGYNVPGEDFNQNLPMMGTPPDLSMQQVVITVQPDTLFEEYFPMEIFRSTIINTPHENEPLDNVHNAISGRAVRR